ncbi:hypothetical protein DKP76_01440 [Falsochrobactrum shanghaiense]|uniref:Uncharacterized protein n=1 Tax=Falsochrobactrum shanghaiense TaxID=2201899 RepID=A0A316JJ19_9HYPH|nr:hypothetical protein [Falsochrobactrum shanghaiense]PWL19253.1 hypothetical protein DKP76_01440 [Falsochrobactrum shanghaiense]
MQHPVRANDTALPERVEVARDLIFGLDDAFGRLDAAIRVMDMLTDGTPANLGTIPLYGLHREIDSLLWSAAGGRP